MYSTSTRRTSESDAVSDSQRISLRTVKSRRCSGEKSAATIAPLTDTTDVEQGSRQVHANVDLAVGVGDLVDRLAPGRGSAFVRRVSHSAGGYSAAPPMRPQILGG
jgi:hypothetical protein